MTKSLSNVLSNLEEKKLESFTELENGIKEEFPDYQVTTFDMDNDYGQEDLADAVAREIIEHRTSEDIQYGIFNTQDFDVDDGINTFVIIYK